MFLQLELSVSAELVKIVQQELAYTSLCTLAAAVKVWYDPDPQSTIIEEDQVFVKAFFAILDEEMEQQPHLQSPWLLYFEMDHTKMINCKLTMKFVASKIKERTSSWTTL